MFIDHFILKVEINKLYWENIKMFIFTKVAEVCVLQIHSSSCF